jgi:hypothetical protein
MINNIKGRIFVVGCPRSGTTLLQSLIAAHPQVISFPESKFFLRLVYPESYRTKLGLTKIGLAAASARTNLKGFLQDIGQEEMIEFLSPNAIFMNQYAKAFVKIMDTITIKQNKSYWLEKTPEHLHRIEYIEKFVSEPKFIHVIRNGIDVVSSLYEVTHQHPESWMGSAWDIDKCITRWLGDVSISKIYLHRPNHLIVKYDDLIENTELIIKKVYEFLDLSFDRIILENRKNITQNLIRNREKWKQSTTEKILKTNGIKFQKLFTEEQKNYIESRINIFDCKFV